MNRTVLRLCLAALTLALSACSASYVPNFLRPYRPDVQQGNIVTKDMVEQLRPGMTRDQVRFLLGTPMLTDLFHQDRWDYTYYLRRKSGETQIRKLSVVFADGKLNRFDSDAMPAEPLADNLILGQKAAKPAAAPASAAPPAPTPEATPAAPVPTDAKH
jgi:outer membrane protein assembly factor BamE